MFCTKCGKEIQEGNAFCTNCGAAVMGAAAKPEPAPQTPPVKAPQEEFILGSAAEVPAKKKFSPKILIPIGIVAVVIAAVLAVVLNWGSISQLFGGSMKPGDPTGEATDPSESTTETVDNSQMSDAEYMRYVESNSAEKMADTLSSFCGSLLQARPASHVEVELNIGSDLLSMLEESYRNSTGEDLDFSFLSSIKLQGDGGQQNSLAQSNLGLLLGNTQILTLNMIVDTAEQTLYMACPELNPDFLRAEVVTPPMVNRLTSVLEAFPDENTFRSLIGKYTDLVFANLDKVTRSTETLELDGLKQDCTVLTVRIYQEDAWKAAKAVLEAAKEDPELKKLIEALEIYESEDLYQNFTDMVQDALDELESVEEFDTVSYFDLISYVDGTDTVIGRTLHVYNEGGIEQNALSYQIVTSGDEYRFELVLDSGEEDVASASLAGIRIDGAGTVKDGTTDGTCTFSLLSNGQFQEMLIAEVSGDGSNGTIRLEPTAALMNMIFFGGDDAGFLSDIALELEYNISDTHASYQLKLLASDVFLAGLKLSASYGTAEEEIRVPDHSVDATDPDALQAWLQNLKFDTLLANLKTAGVPQQLVEWLEQMLSGSGVDTGILEE